MRSRWGVVVPLLVLAACSDGIGPDPVVDTIVLDFCSDETPLWFAYQNAGGDWTRVLPGAGGDFEFDASERVAIAMTFDFGGDMLTDIYYTTATELQPLSDRACVERAGAKVINGSVANVGVGAEAVVSMSAAEEVVTPPPSTFALSGVAEGPQDVVAHREGGSLGALTPDRVIVRRAQSFTNGATMPVLDFSTTTSEAVAANTATISGLSGSETNYLDVYFTTALGTEHTLYLAPFFSTGTQPIYAVPASLTQAGDVHRLDLQAESSAGDAYRTVRHWYRTPANKAIALGAPLNAVQQGFAGTSPYLRMRFQVTSQPDYPSFATAYFIQGSTTTRSVFVTQTEGYNRGTPTVWTLEIPDLTEAGGYPSNAGLVSGQGTQWFVEAFSGTLSDFIGSTPTDGATVRWAGRSSSVTLLRAEGSVTEDSSRRPGILDRRAFTRR